MVTIQEALQQTTQAEVSALERERLIQEAETRAGRIRIGGTLAEQFRFGAALPKARRQARRQREEALVQIGAARQELGRFRGGIAARRVEIGRVEKERGRIERIRRIIAKGGTPELLELNREDRQLVKNIIEGRVRSATISRQLRVLERQGLEPVFVGGELAGFESERALQSFELQQLPFVQPSAVAQLERAGIIDVEPAQLEAPALQSFEAPTPDKAPGIIERIAEKGGFVPPPTILGGPFGGPGISGADLALATVAVGGEELQKALRDPGFGKATLGFPSLIDITPPGRKIRAARETAIGFAAGAASFLVPTTKEEVAIQAGLVTVPLALPASVLKLGAGAFAGVQIPRAFVQPDITLQERVALGATGVFAAGGAAFVPTKFQIGTRQLRAQARILGERGILSPEAEQAALGVIKEFKFFRGQPDIPITKPVVEIIPKGLTQLETEAFGKVLLVEDIRIFGGQAEALRGIRSTKDIDIAGKESRRILNELAAQFREVSAKPVVRRGEAIGLGVEKAFDIKPLERLTEFPLAQRPIKTAEGVKVVGLSEQLERSLAGTLQLRKGGKDIGSVILDTRAFLTQASTRLQETRFPFLKPFRQRALARAERRVEAFEQFTLPEIELQVARFARTIRGRRVKIVDLPPEFQAVTRAPGFREFGFEIERLLPAGRAGRLGGRIEAPRIESPQIRITGIRPRPRFRPSELEISFIRPPKIAPSVFRPSPVLAPSFFAPSLFKPSRIPTGFEPSIFRPERPVRPGRIISPIPSEFRTPPAPPGFPGLGPGPTLPPFVPAFEGLPSAFPRRRKAPERKLKKKKPRERRRLEFPISVSFTAVAADLFGRFPKIRAKGLGLTPEQIRFQPLRRAPRRPTLAGVRSRRTRRRKK